LMRRYFGFELFGVRYQSVALPSPAVADSGHE
jgi:hypothetical protein